MDLLTSTIQLAVRGTADPRQTERAQIHAALDQTGWRIRGPAAVAALLGLKPTAIGSRIKKLGLQRSR
jgi:transcriptional regulator with GAF, ATPase, and Fis domain